METVKGREKGGGGRKGGEGEREGEKERWEEGRVRERLSKGPKKNCHFSPAWGLFEFASATQRFSLT